MLRKAMERRGSDRLSTGMERLGQERKWRSGDGVRKMPEREKEQLGRRFLPPLRHHDPGKAYRLRELAGKAER